MYGGGVMIILCISVSVFCEVSVVNPDKELIFDADRKTFDQITETIDQCFTACPAVTDDQREFNKTKSITKNSLFLRDSIASPASHDTPLVECEYNYEPSMVFRKDSEMFDIGYEVYFNKIEIEGKGLVQSDESYFLTTDQLKAKIERKKLKNRLLGIVSTTFGLKKSKSQKNTKFDDDTGSRKTNPRDSLRTTSHSDSNSDFERGTKDNRGDANSVRNGPKDEAGKELAKNLGLFWIQVFYFDFDVGQYGPIKVVYSADLGKLNAAYQCKNYKADEALYKKVDFKSIYDQTNQEKLFENLPDFPNKPDGKCGQEYGCLKPHQLIPHYYYHSQASKITTCSAVNTIPVWESISDGMLKKIDQYLYVISQIWGPNVSITTGVTNILSYQTRKRNRIGKKMSRKLFMDLIEQKVPVPEIIYKIVKFWQDTGVFYVVIVIHNNPLQTKMYDVCPPNKENSNHNHLLTSWNFVINKNAKFGLSYPCLMEEEVLDRLKVSRKRSNDLFYIQLLLSELPYAVSTKEEQTIDQNNTEEVSSYYSTEKELIEEKDSNEISSAKSAKSVKKELTIDEKQQMIETEVKKLFGGEA